MTVERRPALSSTAHHRRVLAVAGLVPVFSLLIAAPSYATAATAPTPQRTAAVTASTCAAASGVFTLSRATKTCTTVTRETVQDAPVTTVTDLYSTSWPGGSARYTLIGTSHRVTTVVTTVQRSQVALRTVTEATTRTRTSTTVVTACTERLDKTVPGYHRRDTGEWVEGSTSVVDTDMPLTRCDLASRTAS